MGIPALEAVESVLCVDNFQLIKLRVMAKSGITSFQKDLICHFTLTSRTLQNAAAALQKNIMALDWKWQTFDVMGNGSV